MKALFNRYEYKTEVSLITNEKLIQREKFLFLWKKPWVKSQLCKTELTEYFKLKKVDDTLKC